MLPEHRREDALAVDLIADEFFEHMAVAKHEHTRAEADQLLDLAGHVDDRFAGRRELPQMGVEVGLGADVDAARGIVQDQGYSGSSAKARPINTFC